MGLPRPALGHSSKPMIRITISVDEACQALVATLPLGSAAYEPGCNAKGKAPLLAGIIHFRSA